MEAKTITEDSGYSPPISIELHLHGECFNVASAGPDGVILRDARRTSAGKGVVRIDVDGRVTLYQVDVVNGIDPARNEQKYVLLGVVSEAAA